MGVAEFVVPCTKRTEQILLSARAAADVSGHDVVEDVDLLSAFVKEGGGSVGEFLRASGLTLEALTSGLAGEDGCLKQERFDEAAWRVLEGAADCARSKAHVIIGRRHLIYAMLLHEASTLAGLARGQQQDPETLAGMLYSGMQAGSTVSTTVALKVADLARDVMRILCLAEAEASDYGEERISEHQLFRMLALDGGGEAGLFLQKCGVKWLQQARR